LDSSDSSRPMQRVGLQAPRIERLCQRVQRLVRRCSLPPIAFDSSST
jgi:hypothetical protein